VCDRNICISKNQNNLSFTKIRIGQIKEFAGLKKSLNEFNPISIDTFLCHNKSHQEAGQTMIIYSLLKCENEKVFSYWWQTEREDRSGNKIESDNWYCNLINDLLLDCSDKPEKLLDNKLHIVTFNYDMSIDYYLYDQLKNIGSIKKGGVGDKFWQELHCNSPIIFAEFNNFFIDLLGIYGIMRVFTVHLLGIFMVNFNKIVITPTLLSLIAEIDEFKGGWKALSNLAPEKLNLLKKVATIESIGSSTRIEGAKLSDKQVEELLTNLNSYSFRSRDEEEVAGYAEAMNQIFDNYAHISFTENYIKQIHQVLLKYSSKDVRHRGEYKKFSNQVEAFDETGKSLGIIFETVSPFETPMQMHDLVSWTQNALVGKTLHPLLIIGIFVVCFLAIHPFQDGNGRLSRILTTLLLIKYGYNYVPYSSIESIIETNKEEYYLALRRTQITLKSENPEWAAWLIYFLQVLKKQKDRLINKLQRENLLLESLSPLGLQIVQLIRDRGQMNISQIAQLTKVNRNSLKVQLRYLVKQKYLMLCGRGRASWYVVNK
jgi:Fic family protein